MNYYKVPSVLRATNGACIFFNVSLTVHFSITSPNGQRDAQLLYIIIRLLQSSMCFSNVVLIIRRSNCTNTAFGIVTIFKWPFDMQVEREPLNLHSGRPLTDSDYKRCCINKI